MGKQLPVVRNAEAQGSPSCSSGPSLTAVPAPEASVRVAFVGSHKDTVKSKASRALSILGPQLISSVLRQHDHRTLGLNLYKDTLERDVVAALQQFQPQVVGFYCVFSEYDNVKRWARVIRRVFPSVFLIAGGPHVSLATDDCLNDGWDAICVGEGEFPMLELVNQIARGQKPANIANIRFLQADGSYSVCERAPFVEDLDALPLMDHALWPDDTAVSFPTILIGRGCPYLCTYCANHRLKLQSKGKYVRLRSGANIIKELEYFLSLHPKTTRFKLEAETVVPSWRQFLEVCDALERWQAGRQAAGLPRLSFNTNINVAPQAPWARLFAAMKRAGVDSVDVGLESGSERVRRQVLKRYYSNDEFMTVVKTAKDAGVAIEAFVIIGLPGETEREFANETLGILRAEPPNGVISYIYYPYPGTELYDQGLRAGIHGTAISQSVNERTRAVIDTPEFPKQDVERHWLWIDWNLYWPTAGVRKKVELVARLVFKWSVMRGLISEKYYG